MQPILHKKTEFEIFFKPIKHLSNFFVSNQLLILSIFLVFIKSQIFISYISSDTGTQLVRIPYNINYLLYISLISFTFSFGLLFKGRLQVITFYLINFILSLLLLFDLMYFRGFQGFISLYNLSQTGNLDNLWASIASMLRPLDIILFIDIPILLLIKRLRFSNSAKQNPVLFLLILMLGSSIPLYYHYKYDLLESGRNRRFFFITDSPRVNISRMSPIGFHIYDSYNYFENSKRLVLSEKEKEDVESWYAKKVEQLPDNEYKGLLKGKNLIFIQLESFESFLVGRSLEGEEITPSLNKLLNNSLFFSNILEQVKGGTSSDADLIANTSTYPVKNGSTFFRFPDNKYNSLPIMMKKLGYYTSAFHPDGGGYWNWMPALKSMEFDKCTDVTAFNQDEIIGIGLSDATYLRQLSTMIVRQPQPFYSFFVTLSSHGPFTMPEKTKELKLNDSIGRTVLGDYFHAVHYTDKYLGKFIESLESSGIMENTVLVIYGDHAGVTKYYKDKLSAIENREQWWYQENSKVPLLIYSKGLDGKEIKTIGGQVDILPTVAYLMGVDESCYINTAMGRNLLKTNKGFAVLSDGRVIGETESEEEKDNALKGLNISDLLLRSNYFKNVKQ